MLLNLCDSRNAASYWISKWAIREIKTFTARKNWKRQNARKNLEGKLFGMRIAMQTLLSKSLQEEVVFKFERKWDGENISLIIKTEMLITTIPFLVSVIGLHMLYSITSGWAVVQSSNQIIDTLCWWKIETVCNEN